MPTATYADKSVVIDILAKSFCENKSVNYIIPQDRKRVKRLRELMAYSFELCYRFGSVFLSDDQKGCALVLFPDKRQLTFQSILVDARLIFRAIGLRQIGRALRRDATIKKIRSNNSICYLWFIGVDPVHQRAGIGGGLLNEVLQQSRQLGRPIYLETSMEQNIEWYKGRGFQLFYTMPFPYGNLYFFRTVN